MLAEQRNAQLLLSQIVLDENPILDELTVEYVPQIGFLTTLAGELRDRAPSNFVFAFAQVRYCKTDDPANENEPLGEVDRLKYLHLESVSAPMHTRVPCQLQNAWVFNIDNFFSTPQPDLNSFSSR